MNALELRNVKKAYPGFTLGPLDLTLPSGCILGLIGENGAGKTTTIKLILDLVHKDGGTVSFFGRDGATQLPTVKEDLGVVLDEVGIPACLTARQVERMMSHTYRQWQSDQYFRYLQMLDVPTDKEFEAFSRGMRGKLGIAIALAHSPKLMILDEATSGLDPVAREQVVELLEDFTRDAGHAVLISSHIVSDLEKLCDYIAFLQRGQILLCEEKDRLLERFGMLHCTQAQLAALAPGAVRGKRVTAYGVEALVERERLPGGLQAGPVSVEELFLFMVKEGN